MNYDDLVKKINSLAVREKFTKQCLGELSREILAFIHSSEAPDIRLVNKVLSVLTPMNKRTMFYFFKTFSGFKAKDKELVFTNKDKKRYDDKVALFAEFLENEDNNVWTWAADNIKVEPKEIDWAKRLASDFTKALEAGLTVDEVLAILNASIPDTPKGWGVAA